MHPTAALPGSMTWMGIRLSSGSRCPQSPKGPSTALTQSVFCSYGPVVVEWPEMLCARLLGGCLRTAGQFESVTAVRPEDFRQQGTHPGWSRISRTKGPGDEVDNG